MFDERQLQPLGKNIPGDAAQLTADILPMRHGRGERHQLAVVENRQRVDHVVQMAAHDVAVVGKENIAGMNIVLAPVRDLGLDRIRQTADKHRQAETDGNRVAVAIEQPDGKILRLIDDRVIRRAHQIGLHLAGDGDHRAADHLGGERVDPGLAGRGIQHYRFHMPNSLQIG